MLAEAGRALRWRHNLAEGFRFRRGAGFEDGGEFGAHAGTLFLRSAGSLKRASSNKPARPMARQRARNCRSLLAAIMDQAVLGLVCVERRQAGKRVPDRGGWPIAAVETASEAISRAAVPAGIATFTRWPSPGPLALQQGGDDSESARQVGGVIDTEAADLALDNVAIGWAVADVSILAVGAEAGIDQTFAGRDAVGPFQVQGDGFFVRILGEEGECIACRRQSRVLAAGAGSVAPMSGSSTLITSAPIGVS